MPLLKTPEKDDNFQYVDFNLKGTDGKTYSFGDIKDEKGTVIAFICNHCPYVKAVIDRLVEDATKLQDAGIGFAAIMSNDAENYPADSFGNMKLFAEQHGFTFPYLIDETQETAKAYGAVCTPDLYGFNADGSLQYRGRLDSADPNEGAETAKRELLDAMLQIAETGDGPAEQFPSMGCSIKWRQ